MPLTMDIVAIALNALITLLFLPLAFRPPSRNALYGYRTTRSMSSDAAWEYANKLAGRISLPFAACATVAAAVCIGIKYGTELPFLPYGTAFTLIPSVLGLFAAIAVTEIKLAKKAADGSFGPSDIDLRRK